MKKLYFIKLFLIQFLLLLSFSCTKDISDSSEQVSIRDKEIDLTIFFINDYHSQIANFSKLKYLVDKEREETNVMVLSAGDMFSGSPYVDNYSPKGYPMIDLMNDVGFDLVAVGNHEFDYGEQILADRIEQSNFDYIAANIDCSNSILPQFEAFKTLEINGLKITLFSVIETNGKPDDIIPSTHPWKVQNLTFSRFEDVITNYSNLKDNQDADLYIALTHVGLNSDKYIADNFPYFDMIIGGHSHSEFGETYSGIPIFQSGGYLNNVGKISLTIKDRKIVNYTWELINFSNVYEKDEEIDTKILAYLDNADIQKVIGTSLNDHSYSNTGCFYVNALKASLNVDLAFQNTGGVRNILSKGDISKYDIYSISPFNNGAVVYQMSISQIKTFLIQSQSGFYYAGLSIERVGDEIVIKDQAGNQLSDQTIISVGINDYIPSVYESLFPSEKDAKNFTCADALINYVENINPNIDFSNCESYFRY